MKKMFLSLALALASMPMFADNESKFEVNAGIGMSSVVGSDMDGNGKLAFSYKVGFAYDIAVSNHFSVVPGIDVVNKAFKAEWLDGTVSRIYLQVPVFAAYKFNISDDMKLAVKAGPYVSYGIVGGDIEWESGTTNNIFDSDHNFRRFDAGAIAGVSLEMDALSVGLQYSRGLTKLNEDFSAYNQGFGITVGYRF